MQQQYEPRRFLFTVLGGYGHLHPLVPLARALQRAGHAVAFAAGASLRPAVAATGFDFFPLVGAPHSDPEYQAFKAQQRQMSVGLATEVFTYPWLFCGIASRVRTPELVALAQSWRADMLIREGGEYGTVIAAEHLGLPYATIAFAAALPSMAVFEREAATYLDPVRRAWGLPPDPELTTLYRYLYLAYTPPTVGLHEVGMADTAWTPPPTTHFIRPELFDQAGAETLPAWMNELPEQPTVYLTLGTEVNKEPDLYPSVMQTIIAGLRDAPINLIVTLGRDKDPADFGLQPSNVYIERYIPQSLLLPRCDLMVMHGGSNSLLAALDCALPLVVVPLIADQFFNAHVIENLRLGQAVQRDDLTSARIRAALDEVLANPLYRKTAGRLRAEMQALPDQQRAVALVEQIVAQYPPRRAAPSPG